MTLAQAGHRSPLVSTTVKAQAEKLCQRVTFRSIFEDGNAPCVLSGIAAPSLENETW